MINFLYKRPAVFASAVLLLSACDGGSSSSSGFERQYVVSRDALEAGHFDKATRGYEKMLDNPGRYEPRLRLEYAHALLRSNQFEEAATQARQLAQSQSGVMRSAALAVQGTAEHELGMSQNDATGDAYLRSARAALSEALASNPEIDRIGTLNARKTALDKRLSG